MNRLKSDTIICGSIVTLRGSNEKYYIAFFTEKVEEVNKVCLCPLIGTIPESDRNSLEYYKLPLSILKYDRYVSLMHTGYHDEENIRFSGIVHDRFHMNKIAEQYELLSALDNDFYSMSIGISMEPKNFDSKVVTPEPFKKRDLYKSNKVKELQKLRKDYSL